MTPYLSRKIRIVSFLSLLLVFFQHAINFTGYIDPVISFTNMRNWDAYIQYFFGYGITRFAVPLFFLLSAYLFYRNFSFEKLFTKYRSRIRSLLIPYILWNLLGIGFIAVLQSIPPVASYFSSFYTGNVLHKSLLQYALMIVNHGVSFHFWFIWDLMIYTLCAPIIYLLIRYTSFVCIIPLFICWFLRIHIPIPFVSWDSAGVFYLIGVWIALYGKDRLWLHKRSTTYLSTAFLLLCISIKTGIAFGLLPLPLVFLGQLDNLVILSGMSTLWFLYDHLTTVQHDSIWIQISVSTFFVYAAHEPLLDLLKYIFVGLFRLHRWSTLPLFFCIPCVTFIFCFGLAQICKKLLPKVYSLLSGGR